MDEDKPLQFLYEYAVRWSAYSNSLWQISSLLSNLEAKINNSYENSWPEAAYRYRIYNEMTKIWNSEVNTGEVVYKLKDSLRSALKVYHQDIIQHIRDKCVRKETRAMEGVLQKFFQACVDSSINERSVHFI